MTSAAATILANIQRDAYVWLVRNYGPAKPLEQLAGLTEEAGEACEAIGDPNPADYNDAVGDSTIYLLQFMTLMGWSVADVWDGRAAYELPSRPWPILLGRINHAYVKGNIQHYRGTKAEHDARCLQAIGALLKYWDQHLASFGHDFVSVVEQTWRKVAERDWTAVRPAPGEREENGDWTGSTSPQTVEHLLRVGTVPTGEVVRGLAAVIDALGETAEPKKDGG
jgi:hypothetical protein